MPKSTSTKNSGSTSKPTFDFTLEDLLPHRDAMLLVGEILTVEETKATTLCRVATTWPMAEEDSISSLILVEVAAQTAGVCNGWARMQKLGKDSDKMGWLVAVKRADFHVDHLPFGLEVRTEAENTMAFDNFREVTSHIYHEDSLLAEVVLQLYQA
jgi:predicted hotdog family 3-hydroxylacyl-ACP dehydratase